MSFSKCRLCRRLTDAPVRVTELRPGGDVESFDLCPECGRDYGGPAAAIAKMTTPEQVLEALGAGPPCQCGTTAADFNAGGRFGCPACYRHFGDKLEELVFPYHGGRRHAGKRPKSHWLESLARDPEEWRKVLKLRYARALETEKFEEAARLKGELDALNGRNPPATSAGR